MARRRGKPLSDYKPDVKPIGTCWCARNPRTHRGVTVCVVPKSKLHRNGRKFSGRC